MKFAIDSIVLYEAIKRASVLCDKKAAISTLRDIIVYADDKGVIVSANAPCASVNISIPAHLVTVNLSGMFAVNAEFLNRLYCVSGYITVEENGKSISISNGKKKSEIVAEETIEQTYYGDISTSILTINNASSFIEMLSKLGNFLDGGNVRPILAGYNFDMRKKRIVTCDGYRIGIKEFDDNYSVKDENMDITVQGRIMSDLKSIIGKAKNQSLHIFNRNVSKGQKKYIVIKGDDFEYNTALLDGDYIDVDRIVNQSNDYSFSVNAGQIRAITKEYCTSSGSNEKKLLYFGFIKGSVIMAQISATYKTYDIVETDNRNSLADNFIICFDAKLTKEIFDLFDNDETVYIGGTNSNLKAWNITNENYKTVLLPVKPKEPEIVLNYISKNA